ncbi:uncharacterized protein LOC114247617 [Bombyx mandarina]|uniref:Gustatory receptor n=1 Tax=Bombyx mandarina TaxID=7092 RepID=A0A6J2K631_BOMMA|nr:uncharacterized protein LOC114247617 [Bombyx mandarina]
MKRKLKKFFPNKEYNNIVEATHLWKLIRKLTGLSVLTLESKEGDRIETRFSSLGFVFFLLWFTIYFYCTYKAHNEDQTILRNIYSTKLQRYGDDFERITSIIYVLYSMWKLPFQISGNRLLLQEIVDIDKAIESVGVTIDYKKNATFALFIYVGQIGTYLFRLFCVWGCLGNLNSPVPVEKLYQVIFTDALSLLLTSQYCFSLVILRDRCRYINKILCGIENRESSRLRLFVYSSMPGAEKDITCRKIKDCSKIYGMIYKAVESTNITYGFALVLTMLLYLIFIILYMFYFMEATAAGLFLDTKKYIDFLICVLSELLHAMLIIFLNIYFSEETVKETRTTSFVIHGIINSDFNTQAKTEGGRMVFTYLIIMLQFVTERN